MEDIKEEAVGVLKDIFEIGIILAAIIFFSRLTLGAHMLVPLVAVTSCSMYHSGDVLGVGCTAIYSKNWETWLLQNNISKSRVESFPLRGGFCMGDMIITIAPDSRGVHLPLFSDTSLGDVIIYNRDKKHQGNDPIIHRVVGIIDIKNWKIDSIDGTMDCLKKDDFVNKYIPYIRNCIDKRGECPYNEFPKEGDFRFYITKGDNNPRSDQCGSITIALPVNDSQITARGWIRLPFIGWLKLALNKIIPLHP